MAEGALKILLRQAELDHGKAMWHASGCVEWSIRERRKFRAGYAYPHYRCYVEYILSVGGVRNKVHHLFMPVQHYVPERLLPQGRLLGGRKIVPKIQSCNEFWF
ncbi:hypothetical protein XALC_1079 [Xanthomonas albilineans GPE PC73]|uniref:Uncharacterized protein n=1 Tax=Xanthomonas albilineans (strain GPE PC73 / CFBP 7063) TaxID=380358 RepID=D2U8B5_XANAP|nr:hypothetical protein XALC_1079 [Xanthomonas albilineans GPE PC73]